jgi:hypothetical protein
MSHHHSATALDHSKVKAHTPVNTAVQSVVFIYFCNVFQAQTIIFRLRYFKHINVLYRVSQEEMSILWEVKVSVILSKKLYMNMCPIPNGFRDRAI